MTFPDPIAEGLARGWKAHDASELDGDVKLDCDVVIVGTGAGGGTTAEILAQAGLHVIMIEEGPLMSSRDFRMLEREAYPNLYWEEASRQTKDKGIKILQGRSVGGSTTVNWTSCFPTPAETLSFWRDRYGLADYTTEALQPWFEQREHRLRIAPWAVDPNENNSILQRGAKALGIPSGIISRNVHGCYNLGCCSMGCPTNAKQSMLLTTIPGALERGALLYSRTRAQQFVVENGKVTSLECLALDPTGLKPTARKISITAKHYIAAGGAINSPALLMRSGVPDPYGTLGKRTFLHPTVLSAAVMPESVTPYMGAPQSVFSDHFLTTNAIDGPIGYKLEVPPIHPILFTTIMPGFGDAAAALSSQLSNVSAIIALLRDGFHDEAIGGSVQLKSDTTPLLDYPITDYVWEGARRALHTMSDIQFAAGAKSVYPLHESAKAYTSSAEAKAAIDALPMEILRTRVASAHVMGGCGMGSDPKNSVIQGDGRHHQVENLHVFDGSSFPTSLGVNPQLSIYAMIARNATQLARSIG